MLSSTPFTSFTVKLLVAVAATAAAVVPPPPPPPPPIRASELVELPPNTPADLSATEATKDAITVSWQAPASGSTPTRYIVKANPDCGGKTRTKRVSADTTSVTFNKLRRCDTYILSVHARNTVGKGEWAKLTWHRPQPQSREPEHQRGNNQPEHQGGEPEPEHQASEDKDLAEVLRCTQNPDACDYAQETGTTQVMGQNATFFVNLGYAIGCAGAKQCDEVFNRDFGNSNWALSGHSPLRITGVYLLNSGHLPLGAISSPAIFTITLNGDWPDSTVWTLETVDFALNNSYVLNFDDAKVTGRYATWTGIAATPSDTLMALTTFGPITKPA